LGGANHRRLAIAYGRLIDQAARVADPIMSMLA